MTSTKRREDEGLRDLLEEQLLNYAIEIGTLDFLQVQRIKPSFFRVYYEEAKQLYEWYSRTGSLPTRETTKKRIPAVRDWGDPPHERDVPHIIEDLRKIEASNQFMQMIDSYKEDFAEGRIDVIAEKMPKDAVKIRETLNEFRVHNLIDPTERFEFFVKQANNEGCDIEFAHPELNEYVGNIFEGEVHVIVARLGEGKSFMALGDAFHNWKRGLKGVIFSLEMPRVKLGQRLEAHISQEGDEPGFSIQGLKRGVAVRDAEHEPSERPNLGTEASAEQYRLYCEELKRKIKNEEVEVLHIITPRDCSGPITPSFIESTARDLGVDFVVVDQLDNLSADSGQKERRHRLGECIRDLKNVAERIQVPMFVVHQINREGAKTKEVTELNIAESDDVGRQADSVVYLDKDSDSNLVTLRLLKLRDGPKDRKFAWYWDYDNGIRYPVKPFVSPVGDGSEDEEEKRSKLEAWASRGGERQW